MASKTESGIRSGAVLDLLMQRSKLSPRKLAELVNVSHTTVYARVKGEDWNYADKARYSDVFGVPEELFDMSTSDAGRWLIDHNRFDGVIDLTGPSDQGFDATGWTSRIGLETQFEEVPVVDLRERSISLAGAEATLVTCR